MHAVNLKFPMCPPCVFSRLSLYRALYSNVLLFVYLKRPEFDHIKSFAITKLLMHKVQSSAIDALLCLLVAMIEQLEYLSVGDIWWFYCSVG